MRIDGKFMGLRPQEGPLCGPGSKENVLKIDRPVAVGFLGLMVASPPRVVDCPTGETTHWIFSRLPTPYSTAITDSLDSQVA